VLAINVGRSIASCRMRLLIASNDGADRDMMRSLAAVAESLIFVYLGKVYQKQPILLTVSLWARAPRKLGLTDRHLPVLGWWRKIEAM
jgi:hypothetical protein